MVHTSLKSLVCKSCVIGLARSAESVQVRVSRCFSTLDSSRPFSPLFSAPPPPTTIRGQSWRDGCCAKSVANPFNELVGFFTVLLKLVFVSQIQLKTYHIYTMFDASLLNLLIFFFKSWTFNKKYERLNR